MANAFQKAKKEKIYVKALLFGSSGSGKTYSALRLATGIYKNCGGTGIAVIDTEAGRSKYYANEFDFDVLELSEPYTPEKFIDAIQAAINGGYKVLVIDSTSHEWQYLTAQANAQSTKNPYAAWGKLKPRHRVFMEKLLFSPIHIVSTGRGKDEYTMDDSDGKKSLKKVGVGVQQDKDAEYDYTVAFNIMQDTHMAEATKDNTHLFEGNIRILTEEDGEKLFNWANSGDGESDRYTNTATSADLTASLAEDDVDDLIQQITALFKDKMEQGIEKEKLYGVVAENNNGTKNFATIKDAETANRVIEALLNI